MQQPPTRSFYSRCRFLPLSLLITLPVPSVRLTQVCWKHSQGYTCCWKKDVRHNCVWVLVCDRAAFPRDQGTAANAQKHTHAYTHAVWTEALSVPKEQGCFMCVWLSLFQLAWNSQSRSESLRYAWRGGLVLWCEQGTPTFCGCTWLSEHVCLCLHSGWRRTLDFLHLSVYNRCVRHEDVKEKQQHNYLLKMKLCPFQLNSINTRLQSSPQLLLFEALFSM